MSAWAAPLVIVVAYKSDAHLPALLADFGPSASIVVVDNDAAGSAIRTVVETAGARYLATDRNVGFAAAVNLALDTAWDGRSDVLLLNPDARISTPDVATMQHALRAPGERRAAVGPRLLGFDAAPQRSDWPMPSPLQVWVDALGLSRFWRGRRFVPGTALLLHGAALAEIGRFDERYFLYAEEADWQLRAQRAGWSVGVVDEVVATHVGGASSSDDDLRNVIFHASGEAFARRWYGTVGWWTMRLGALVAAGRRCFAGPRTKRAINRRTFMLYARGPMRSRAARERAA